MISMLKWEIFVFRNPKIDAVDKPLSVRIVGEAEEYSELFVFNRYAVLPEDTPDQVTPSLFQVDGLLNPQTANNNP